ncbi:DUF6163 family protein [Methylosinus sp. Sm6]|uniref:DUF6163 family protein n=1 Tax=Methylosinus sp. Sm6 TaxID=2866948 RepID=UPI001C9904A0|nr:DUF6163 family protein [Methylosinus sp. Sm6]MBY6241466.1 DUF6163 family protein [Methylosinus sp. Sm6]
MTEHSLYDDDDPHRPIRVGEASVSGEATRWGQMLTLFMRVMALFWLAQGLMQWRLMLMSQQPIFDALPTHVAVAIVFFAVLDLIAGVGLWLATPWGGVLWLLIASAQIFMTATAPGFFFGGYWLVAFDLTLIGLYFFLTFEAGRDYEAQRLRDKRRRRRTGEIEAAERLHERWRRRLRETFSRLDRL